ncbi:AraC family transcriptional regulator [Mycobacterium sp. 1165196.3]|nr:AraC family transcriptional regulator [Mycobacterium sp. 1482292.6]OBJ15445.1 AraC family transcriptional regulator [Mycobacterium sp. 1245801.1]OBJ85225.1 AraC family transcriptional regulator [Mycobacterium sp. 1245852.3]OBK42450.1 AraC family transcriptional regulator [Mycobacterium sp. 1165196.3]OBL13925.1 AraC family transcriptional regulator [Mycobacterium sp. 1245499.0]
MDACKNTPPAGAPEPGVVGRAATGSIFELDRTVPSVAAAEFVEHFWSVRWDLTGRTPQESLVITFPSINLTHEWGTDSPRHGFTLPATLVHGVVQRIFAIELSGRGAVVGARFRPGGFTARFRRDASALTGRVVCVDDDLFDSPALFDDDIDGTTAQLDAMIGTRTDPDPTYTSLNALLDRIRDDDAIQRVQHVMACSPWSVRTTQRVFRHYVGVPVKWVLCRYRLQQAALAIETDRSVDLADLAVRLGWYDQAHFTNDFRSMLGCSPGEYAQRYA